MTLFAAAGAVVVDASVAIEFLGDDPAWARRWVEWISSETLLVVPVHFTMETANGLMRGQRLSADQTEWRLRQLFETGLEVADRGEVGLMQALRLAERHDLTVYDATYLQLAIDIEGELATLDDDLLRAAAAEDIDVVGAG